MALRQLNNQMPVTLGNLAGGRNIVTVSPATAQRLILSVFEAVPAGAARR
jgi:hypothetical protein